MGLRLPESSDGRAGVDSFNYLKFILKPHALKENPPWWLFISSGLLAIITLIGGIVSSLVAAAIQQTALNSYRPWVWGLFILFAIVSISTAIWSRRSENGNAVVDIRQAHQEYTGVRQRYLARIVERFQFLPLRAVDFKTASAETAEQERLRMSDVYIALDTTARVAPAGGQGWSCR